LVTTFGEERLADLVVFTKKLPLVPTKFNLKRLGVESVPLCKGLQISKEKMQ